MKVFINLPTRGWLITIRNDGISVNWDVVRGIPEFNHLLPGSHYCWPSSLSTARQLTRCPKFKQHAENMMENQRGAKHQSSPFPPAPQFQQLTILEQANVKSHFYFILTTYWLKLRSHNSANPWPPAQKNKNK